MEKICVIFFSTAIALLKLMVNVNPLSANPTKWSNTLRQFVELFDLCLAIFLGLALKGLSIPVPVGTKRENELKFLFSHFFVAPKKVL